MPRRVNLPGASELFRATEGGIADERTPPPEREAVTETREAASRGRAGGPADPEAGHTGRVRHDEKITVYVSAAELIALEQARLTLRAGHGLAVDRGRIVRAAVAAALADLDDRGSSSDLVARLREA